MTIAERQARYDASRADELRRLVEVLASLPKGCDDDEGLEIRERFHFGDPDDQLEEDRYYWRREGER